MTAITAPRFRTVPQPPMFPQLAFNTNPALTAALQDAPGYRDAEGAGARMHAATTEVATALRDAINAQQSLTDRVVDAARTGTAMPKSLTKAAADAGRAVADATAAVAIVREADQRIRDEAAQVIAAAPDAVLAHLNGQLSDLLANARAAGVDDVHSPQEAIDAGLVDEWQNYQQMTSQYRTIRAAQDVVLTTLLEARVATVNRDTFGQVRNYADVFPQWLTARREIPTGTRNGEPTYPTPPWDDHGQDGLWHYAVRHHDVDLWVPTQRQLHQAVTAATTAAQHVENAKAREDDGLTLNPTDRQTLEHYQRQLDRGGSIDNDGRLVPNRGTR